VVGPMSVLATTGHPSGPGWGGQQGGGGYLFEYSSGVLWGGGTMSLAGPKCPLHALDMLFCGSGTGYPCFEGLPKARQGELELIPACTASASLSREMLSESKRTESPAGRPPAFKA
jgi:hypothetical protein